MFNESQAALAAQQAGSSATGVPIEESAILASLGHWPGVTTASGWNGMRIGRTITNGGYNRRAIEAVSPSLESKMRGGGTLRKWVGNNANPRSWTRFNDAAQVHGYNDTYTPANFLSHTGNSLFNKYAGNIDPETTLGKRFSSYGIGTEDKEVFQSGAYGKFTASNKLYNSRKLSKKKFSSVMDYIEKNDSNLMTHMRNAGMESVNGEFGTAKALGRAESKAMGDFVAMTGDHAATNLVGGYMSASRGMVTDSVKGVAEAAGKKTFLRGVSMAESHLALGGMEHAGGKLVMKETGERVGRSLLKKGFGEAARRGGAEGAMKFGSAIGMKAVGAALPGVNVLMAAMMVHDIAEMGMELVKGGVNLAKDGIVSMKGSIDKPIMGMGFRDNEIAATSRARGVSAIQNSRLNARSVLGNEAASAFAHFG